MGKRIEATIGYREICDDGEVRYYSDWSGQGYVYKDDEAFKSGEGIAYIREATFEHALEDYGRNYVTLEQIEQEDDCCSYDSMMKWVRWYFKGDDRVDGKPWASEFYKNVCAYVYGVIDWQGFDLVLDETDWDEDIEEFNDKMTA